MSKRKRINQFKLQIAEICEKHSYELIGDIRKCKIDDNAWTFAVKMANKNVLVKLIVPFGRKNTWLCVNSPEHISAIATLFGMRGLGGAIDIPITKEYHFKLPETAFGFDKENLEKVFLVYPKCTHFNIRENDARQLTEFRVGLKLGDVSIHDGASFKHFLETQGEPSRFAEFGE